MRNPLLAAIFTYGILVFGIGCSREEPSPIENPLIGVVRTPTHEFTLHAGSEGILYSIRDAEDFEIAREISLQDLAVKFPELSEELRSLWAGNDRINATDNILKNSSSLEPADEPASLIERIKLPSPSIEVPESGAPSR